MERIFFCKINKEDRIREIFHVQKMLYIKIIVETCDNTTLFAYFCNFSCLTTSARYIYASYGEKTVAHPLYPLCRVKFSCVLRPPVED